MRCQPKVLFVYVAEADPAEATNLCHQATLSCGDMLALQTSNLWTAHLLLMAAAM